MKTSYMELECSEVWIANHPDIFVTKCLKFFNDASLQGLTKFDIDSSRKGFQTLKASCENGR